MTMMLDFLRSVFSISSSFVKIPAVRAADDDDDEEELQDPHDGLRVQCRNLPEAIELRKKYDECNKRVLSKKKTFETCEEEIHDWIRLVDNCAAKELFDHLK